MNRLLLLISCLFIIACNPRIQEKSEWQAIYKQNGIDSAGFEILEQSKERVFYCNKELGNTVYPSGKNALLLLSLVALEKDIVSRVDDSVKVNNTYFTSLNNAFKVSDTLYFQQLLNQVGRDELKIWIDTLKYGNKYVSQNLNELMNNLKATPDEHVGIMKKLYFDQLPFSSHTQSLARTLFPTEDKINYTRKSYKQIIQENSYMIYQDLGFIEDSTNHPYFYVNTICNPQPLKDSTTLLSKTTKEILASIRLNID